MAIALFACPIWLNPRPFLKEHQNVAEQQSTIAELKTTVAQQRKQIAVQQATAAQQQKQIEALTATVQQVSDQVAPQ